ncbi:hypothetical protein JCM3765_002934 [Sporobolomyces pararoseus]
MAFSTPRKPARSQLDSLDGEEVLEITLFAEKREWIQDKITFLSNTLPRIVVHEPLPPLPSTTTKGELEEWWKEHEAIETEVHEYDYGDLTKMRNFAKQKSKQQLSRRDTDLIEVCLTTIFALDKLLSLLRQRRKSLVLLEYRLQWEESLNIVWTAHRQLLSNDIPSFLAKSQFSIPPSDARSPFADDESLAPESIEPGSLSKSLSISSITSSSSTSSSTSIRRRRLSSLSNHSHSRALRHQTLLLSLSSLKSHLHQLTSTHLATSSSLLDKLIDHSPEPLPDAFLDEQDKVEDTVKADFGVKGGDMSRWLEGRIEEWKRCDDVHWKSIEVEKESELLAEEVEAELGKLRIDHSSEAEEGMKEWVAKFEERLSQSQETLDQARQTLGAVKTSSSSSRAPPSIQQSSPQILEDSRKLSDELEDHLRRVDSSFKETARTVDKFRTGVKAIERGSQVRRRLLEALNALQQFHDEIVTLPSPLKDDVELLERKARGGKEVYEKRFDELLSTSNYSQDEIKALAKEGLVVVGELARVGIDPNSRRELKELIEHVEESRKEVDQIKGAENDRRKRQSAIENVLAEIARGRQISEGLRVKLNEEAWRVKWEEGKQLVAAIDLNVQQSVLDIRQGCIASLKVASNDLAESPQVLSKLSEQVTILERDLDSLSSLQDAVDRARAQVIAVNDLMTELDPTRSRLEDVSREAESSIAAKNATSDEQARTLLQLESRLDCISSTLSPLLSNVHLRIPFLSSSASSDSPSSYLHSEILPFDTTAQDSSVKMHVNTLISRINREREETREKLDSLRIVHKVTVWEEERASVEANINKVEAAVIAFEEAILDRQDDEEDTLRTLKKDLESISETNLLLRAPIETLTSSLSELPPPNSLSRLPPHLQINRQQLLEDLKHHQSELSSRISDCEDRIEVVRSEREERVTSWRNEQLRLAETVQSLEEEALELAEEGKRALEELEQKRSHLDAKKESIVNGTDTSNLVNAFSTFLHLRLSTLDQLSQRLQVAEGKITACSNDFSLLESTSTSSQVSSDDLSSTRSAFEAVQATHKQTLKLAQSIREGSTSFRSQLSQVEVERQQQLEEQANLERIRLQQEEEEEMATRRRFAARLALAKEIALPGDETVEEEEEESEIIPSESSKTFDVFGQIPSSSLDLFANSHALEDPPEISDLRAKAEMLPLRDWLDSEAILRLPNLEESNELKESFRHLKQDLTALETSDTLVDLQAIQSLVKSKEREIERISKLANFSARVETADTALSNLLDSIDAVSSPFPSPSPTSQHSAPLSLSGAIVQASDAVAAARLEAASLSGDRRVMLAIARIEESWTEMMLMAEEAPPRSGSRASSTSDRTTSSMRIPSRQIASHPMSRSSSSSSSTASLQLSRSRTSSRSSTPALSSQTPSLRRSLSRSSSSASIASRTSMGGDPLATPRRRTTQSGLPLPTPRRHNASSIPPLTPTATRPFSFSTRTPNSKVPSSIPRRTPVSTPRKIGGSSRSSSTSQSFALNSSTMDRSVSTSSRDSSRRESLTSSVSSRRSSSSYHRPSLSPEDFSRIGYRSSPPRNKRPQYRANLSNKLDREVGSIVNALDIHVPIEMADGSGSDESGMYKIGDKVYFCRILRSKNVMVRRGGGWENLLQFIITHFAPTEKINISPTTPVKRTLGNEPHWISSTVVRDQLKPTQPTSSPFLRSKSHSSHPPNGRQDDQPRSLSASISMRRSISSSSSNVSTPLRRSIGHTTSHQALLSPTITQGGTPRQQSARRPAIPLWRP